MPARLSLGSTVLALGAPVFVLWIPPEVDFFGCGPCLVPFVAIFLLLGKKGLRYMVEIPPFHILRGSLSMK
jgi:hypothetical protein